jgi:adenylate cyclase, class 2
MNWEVEQKFPLTDQPAIATKLASLGVKFGPPIHQIDHYLNHPARNFAATDEALRVRQVGEQNFITYKGPKIDLTTKTRREIELPLPTGQQMAEHFLELLAALGFRPVATVRKVRKLGHCPWMEHAVEIAWDEVDALGAYLELEISADDKTLAAATAALKSFADHLGIGPGETRSYLELQLARAP